MASQAELQLIIQALDRASRDIQRIGGGLEGLRQKTVAATRGADAFNRASARSAAALGLINPQAATATAQIAALTNVTGAATVALGGLALAGIGITAGLFASGRAAISFEKSFAGIKKTVEATEAEFAQLAKANRALAIELATTTSTVNEVGQAAGSLGITGVQNIARFEKIILQLVGASDDLTASQAAFDFGGLRAVLKLTIDDIDRLTSVVVDLGNKFVTTEGEITKFLTNIAGAGAVLKIPSQDLAAIAAALASVRAEAEAGGTAAQRVLLALQQAAVTGGDELRVFSAVLGVTTDEFKSLIREDPTEAFVRFVEGLQAAGEDAIRVLDALGLSDVRLTREFLKLASAVGGPQGLRAILEEANAEVERGTARQEEFDKRMSTTSAQIARAKARLNELGITVGTVLLPAISKAAQGLGLAAEAAAKLLGALDLGNRLDLVVLGLLHIVTVFTGPLGLIASITFLAFRWEAVFKQLPGPVQSAAIAIANIFDGLVGGIFDAINAIAAGIAGLAGKIGGAIGRIPGAGKIPGVRAAQELVAALSGLSLDLEAPDISRQLRLLAPIHRRGGAGTPEELRAALGQGGAPQGGLPSTGIEGLDALLNELEGSGGKAAKEIDILSDGIIDLAEATAHGITVHQAAFLELLIELEELANRAFRAQVDLDKASQRLASATYIRQRALVELAEAEAAAVNRTAELRVELAKLFILFADAGTTTRAGARLLLEAEVAFAQTTFETRSELAALNVLIGRAGLSGQAGTLRHALATLGEGFRDATESVAQFLQRLSDAAVRATQQAFDALFARPTREEAGTNLRIAQLRRERLLAEQSGNEARVEAIDRELDALRRALDLRRAEQDIMRANADLADRTLLTDREQLTQAHLLIGVLAQQSELLRGLNLQLAFEAFARAAAIGALGDFTAALVAARDVLGSGGRLGAGGGIGGTAGGALNIDVHVQTEMSREAIVREVTRETDRALRNAGFGGSFTGSGVFVPA